jgi:hypothetical protein
MELYLFPSISFALLLFSCPPVPPNYEAMAVKM